MDEQTSQQSGYDASSDGLVDGGYADERTAEVSELSAPEDGLAPDGIRVSDGEIEMGDDFLGDMPEAPKVEDKKPDAPKWYTDEELKATPFEQWDTSRLNGDIGRFAPIVQDQLRQRAVQRNAQAMQEAPLPSDIVEPKQYTPKELAEASLKLACEKLGLNDPDDFDAYEAEHSSAFVIARQELLTRRNAEISVYQTALQCWHANQRFAAELARQPDFKEFNDWYIGKCQENGVSPEHVNAELMNIARKNGNRFDLIAQTIGSWYQEFRQTRTKANPPAKWKRPGDPAVLESTRGNNYAGTGRISAQKFRNMDYDQQAEALMQMGIV